MENINGRVKISGLEYGFFVLRTYAFNPFTHQQSVCTIYEYEGDFVDKDVEEEEEEEEEEKKDAQCTIYFRNGDIFEGTINGIWDYVDGSYKLFIKKGKGMMTYKNGDEYKGEWVDNIFHKSKHNKHNVENMLHPIQEQRTNK